MATMTNAALKYKEMISKSYEINKGSPTCYQLIPKKENIGTLKRMTLGEKNPNKLNKTILLVGGTGTGKSALINTLVNFAIGVKWEDDVWFQIVEEQKDQTQSQTSDVIVYEIFGHEEGTLPYSLTIIDTPGHGSTGGIEHDEIVSERLHDLFRSVGGVHEINAVGLVLKASENRLDERLSYIFNSVVSLFGKDLEQNIVALITHSTGRTPKNALKALDAANIKCARNDKNQPVHFLFDNCQNEARTEDEESLKDAYNKAMKGMEQFTDFLHETAPRELETTVHVLNERIRLTACVQNLQERIQYMELKQKEIQQTQDALKKCEEGMKKCKEGFTIEVDEPYKDKEPVESGASWLVFYEGAVTCKVCEENCHFPGCTMARTPSHCEVMRGGRCTSCTKKCPAADHVKEGKRWVTKTRKVTKTLQDVKMKNEDGREASEGFTIEVDESYKVKEPVKSGMWGLGFYEGAVTCNVCKENCHFPGCTMAHKPSHCHVMRGGRCTSCSKKCPAEDHVKEGWKWVTKTRKVTKTLEVKQKYEEIKAQNGKNMGNLESLEKEMKNLEAHKAESLYEAYNHVVKLEQIALNVVSVSTYVHLDFLIKEMEKKGDTEKVQKLQEMSRRKDKGVIAAIKYLYHKLVSSK